MLNVISTSDVISDIIKQARLIPKTIKLAFVHPLNMVNMHITQKRKLITANACIDLISLILVRKLFICVMICFSSGYCLYFACRLLIRFAIARNLFVYASIINEIAGNNSAGVVIESSIHVKIR